MKIMVQKLDGIIVEMDVDEQATFGTIAKSLGLQDVYDISSAKSVQKMFVCKKLGLYNKNSVLLKSNVKVGDVLKPGETIRVGDDQISFERPRPRRGRGRGRGRGRSRRGHARGRGWGRGRGRGRGRGTHARARGRARGRGRAKRVNPVKREDLSTPEVFKNGDQVIRKGEKCSIASIDWSLQPPAVTIIINSTGQRVGTELHLLKKIGEPDIEQARASVPAEVNVVENSDGKDDTAEESLDAAVVPEKSKICVSEQMGILGHVLKLKAEDGTTFYGSAIKRKQKKSKSKVCVKRISKKKSKQIWVCPEDIVKDEGVQFPVGTHVRIYSHPRIFKRGPELGVIKFLDLTTGNYGVTINGVCTLNGWAEVSVSSTLNELRSNIYASQLELNFQKMKDFDGRSIIESRISAILSIHQAIWESDITMFNLTVAFSSLFEDKPIEEILSQHVRIVTGRCHLKNGTLPDRSDIPWWIDEEAIAEFMTSEKWNENLLEPGASSKAKALGDPTKIVEIDSDEDEEPKIRNIQKPKKATDMPSSSKSQIAPPATSSSGATNISSGIVRWQFTLDNGQWGDCGDKFTRVVEEALWKHKKKVKVMSRLGHNYTVHLDAQNYYQINDQTGQFRYLQRLSSQTVQSYAAPMSKPPSQNQPGLDILGSKVKQKGRRKLLKPVPIENDFEPLDVIDHNDQEDSQSARTKHQISLEWLKDEVWKDIDAEILQEVKVSFMNKQSGHMTPVYKFDFINMVVWNRQTSEKMPLRVRQSAPAKLKVQGTIEPLPKGSDEYNKVLSEYQSNLFDIYEVVNIAKIECEVKDFAYNVQKDIFEQTCNSGANERRVWHGTKKENIDKIVNQGFLRQLGQTMAYGDGTYFASEAMGSLMYATTDSVGTKHMFLCDLLVGDCCKGRSRMKVPEPKDGMQNIPHETMVDKRRNPTIFVATKDDQARPRYLVTFRAYDPTDFFSGMAHSLSRRHYRVRTNRRSRRSPSPPPVQTHRPYRAPQIQTNRPHRGGRRTYPPARVGRAHVVNLRGDSGEYCEGCGFQDYICQC